VETAVNPAEIESPAANAAVAAIAGCGAVTAAGRGLAALHAAVAANGSALQRRECLIGKTQQSVVAGFVP